VGKEIVYCEICGTRILEREFEQGKAITLLNKHYCMNCKQDAVQNIAVEDFSTERLESEIPKHESTSRMRAPNLKERTPHRGSSAHLPHPGPRRPSKILWIAGALGLFVLALTAFLLLRSSPSSSPDPERIEMPKGEQSWKSLRAALERAEADRNYDAALAAIDRARPDLAGSRYEAEVSRLRGEYESKKKERKVLDLLREIDALRVGDPEFQKFSEVSARYEEAEAEARRSATGRIPDVVKAKQAYGERFEEAANQIYLEIFEQVKGLMDLEEWGNAMKVLDRQFPSQFRKAGIWRTTLEPLYKRCEERLRRKDPH